MRRWSIAQLLLISCWQLSHGHYKLPPGRSDLNAGIEEDDDLHASSMDDFPVDTAESLETGSYTIVLKMSAVLLLKSCMYFCKLQSIRNPLRKK
jgi:hypothetical protein